MAEVPWGQSPEAYKAIHDKIAEVLTKLDTPTDPQTVEIVTSIALSIIQSDPALLKATVTPSGDMARKAFYDRNPILIRQIWWGLVSSHNWTQRWSYTVPSGKKAMHYVMTQSVEIAIVTDGRLCKMSHQTEVSGVSYGFAEPAHWYGKGYATNIVENIIFALNAGNKVKAFTYHNDTVSHNFTLASLILEFDE